MTQASVEYGADWSAALRRGTDPELRRWLDLAMAACDEADAVALEHFRRDLQIETKPDRTLVTQADTAIERRIRQRIADMFPEHGLVGEEYGVEAGDAPIRWYIDPIDGTHNFIRGVPLFGTLLAVERDGELQVAVLSAPALGERWWGHRGGGAWARTRAQEPRRVRVSGVASLGDAQILYGSGREIMDSGLAPGFEGLLRAVWRDRGFGDFWGYALVAEGAAEAMIEVGLKSWDAAAPTVLIEEAGGRVTDFTGRRDIEAGTIVASNGRLHATVRARLTEA
ncbi:MAG TPA: inositol monophosphatase family protein [Candidatus Limnocylindrales bacterium]|jgi:histidinol-phosphatase|nr:inositol monophosphatase family protein [Candidatus Limnocylindrales bacterium]